MGGAWTVLKFMYPDADVPVFQLSIDFSQDLDWHLSIGKYLSDLRNHGVLILGSGNVVHNLSQIRLDGEGLGQASKERCVPAMALPLDTPDGRRRAGKDDDFTAYSPRLGNKPSTQIRYLERYKLG